MPRSHALAIFALIPGLFTAPAARAEEDDVSASGFDNMRIEQEEKLLVPMEIADEVLAFLKRRYVEDTARLAELDPRFGASFQEEDFTDVYFDTPSLQLLALESGVRHRTRVNLTNPEHRKSGRELMQLKYNNISSNALERGEVKFAIERKRRPGNPEDAHPMLGIVQDSHRAPFKKRLVEWGLDPQAMRPILTVRDLRTRVYITKEGQPFLSISFDQARSQLLWAETHFVEIEPELNEIAFTDADPEARRYMESILTAIVNDIRATYPQIQSNLHPKYNKSFSALEAQIPFLRTLVRAHLHETESFASLVLLVIGGAGLGIYMTWESVSRRQQRSAPPPVLRQAA
jgi:hypothetical protein